MMRKTGKPNQPDIAPGSSDFPREDNGILPDRAKILRQLVHDLKELCTLFVRRPSFT
jgi:hypothetical protein